MNIVIEKSVLWFILCLIVISIILINVSYSQVTDKDGNKYNIVTIGKTEWIMENLNVEHYCNGDVIPQVQDKKEWSKLTTGAWCYYDNNTENGKTYGKLYNWYAVTDPRGLAPEGWHVPSDSEWTILSDYLGGVDVAGKKMKSTDGWYNNGGGTNSSGFNAIPSGVRDGNGRFDGINIYICFWSVSKNNNGEMITRNLICEGCSEYPLSRGDF